MKDIVNHYRTLLGEALMALDLGHAQEWVEETAYRLGKRIKPEPVNPLEGWQDMGWLDEAGARELYDSLRDRMSVSVTHYLNQAHAGIVFGDTPSAEALRAFQAPKVEGAEVLGRQMAESIRPAVERLLGEGKVEWMVPEITTADAMARAREALGEFKVNLPAPDFAVDFQSMASELAAAVRLREEGIYPVRFLAGIGPDDEWIEVPKANVERHLTHELDDTLVDPMKAAAYGIPLYQHPERDDLLRMKASEVAASPHAAQILNMLFPRGEAAQE